MNQSHPPSSPIYQRALHWGEGTPKPSTTLMPPRPCFLVGSLLGAGARKLRCTAGSQARHTSPQTCTTFTLTDTGKIHASRQGKAPWGSV